MRRALATLVFACGCHGSDGISLYADPDEAFVSRENLLRGAHVIAEVQIGEQLPSVERPRADGVTFVDHQWRIVLQAALWRPNVAPRSVSVLTIQPAALAALNDAPNRARLIPGRRLLVGSLKSGAFVGALTVIGSWRIDPTTRTLLDPALGFPAGTPVDAVLNAATLRGVYNPDSGAVWVDPSVDAATLPNADAAP
ncbi:MAG: hypothetical protein Q8S73_43535 [Deltaproteobacteria bacterium]|nr:hypothetical protein [Myxococcales bacterium]MDP3221037.1 hypothetical protein [Deltaproteobacteria bacterium]